MIELRPLPGELLLFARILVGSHETESLAFARRLLDDVSTAGVYRRRRGLSHPEFGDGTLVSRLMKFPMPAISYADEPEFLTALRIVVDVIMTHNSADARTLAGG